jgi:hypothetical protein
MSVKPDAIDAVVTLAAPEIAVDTEYTQCFWFQVGAPGESSQYIAFAGGEAGGLNVFYPSDGGIITVDDGASTQINITSPDVGEWAFGVIILNDPSNLKTFKWATACDTEFAAENTADIDGGSSMSTALLGNSVSSDSPNINGAFALARQWSRVLSDEELIAEKASLTAVSSDSLWASNPLADDADTSDESGNDNFPTFTNLITFDEVDIECIPPDPPVTAPCTDLGRATRAYVSGYDRARVQQCRLYRFEKRCLIANFNGALGAARTIASAVWRIDAPWVGVISTPQITEDGRESSVLFASQLGGWANIRCEVTLDNGEIYNQVFRVNVREASYFFDDSPPTVGPYSVTVTA